MTDFPRIIGQDEARLGDWQYVVLECDRQLTSPRAFDGNALGPRTNSLGHPVSGEWVFDFESLIEKLAELAAAEHFWNDTYDKGWPYTFVIFMDGEEAARAVVNFEPVPTFSADEVTLTKPAQDGAA